MKIIKTGHLRSELFACEAEQTSGKKEYVVLHFCTAFELTLNGKSFRIEPHGCVICNFNDIGAYDGNDANIDWFCISDDISNLLVKYGLTTKTVYYSQNNVFITKFFRKLEAELELKSAFYEEICEAYLNEFFVFLSREAVPHGQNVSVDPKTKEKIDYLHQQITMDFSRKWTIEDMAKLVNFSPSYLHTVYKRIFGVSPLSYIITLRIKRAKMMLIESKMPINEIADNLGYSNATHFIRQFTGKVGISPLKYRSKYLTDKK